ncbi:Tfp pilus assembly protein FimT/FimU [Chloroflexota bacterium]
MVKRLIRGMFILLRQQKGMSLIETLLALGILGAIGTVYISAVSTGSRTEDHVDKIATAERLVRNQAEDIKNASFDLVAPYEYLIVDHPIYYSIFVDVEADEDNTLHDITITVDYEGSTLITLDTFKVKGL